MAHDILSPSYAGTWLNCPGAVSLAQGLPPEQPSPYAEEGTQAHAQAERAARSFLSGHDVPFLPLGDEDMIRHAKGWAKMIERRVGTAKNLAYWDVEHKLYLGPVTGRPASGTADFIAIDKAGVLTIADYKYGMGVEVEAERNPQLSIYALAAMSEFDLIGITAVRLIIYQPRLSSVEKVYVWDSAELLAWGKEVGKKAGFVLFLMSDKDEASKHLVPGESQCRFCKAKAVCPALREKAKALIAEDFDVIDAPAKPSVPSAPEDLARVLPWVPLIKEWCSAVEAQALSLLETGTKVPGYKLVVGRKGLRKWADGAEDEIKRMHIKAGVLYEKKFVSPSALEKAKRQGLIGPGQWMRIQRLITQAEGKPTVVPESDKRPAIKTAIADEFTVIEGENHG